MSSGTSGAYWQERALPGVLKHTLLSKYIPQFGGMTGSRTGRVVYLDGYAGEGRYESGEPGSAEIALRVASHQLTARRLLWKCFLAERDQQSAEKLEQVAVGYRARGVDVTVRPLDVDGVLDEVLAAAVGVPLFLFLDPCGLGLPMDRLAKVAAHRPAGGAPTELLMNFSMDAVRRLGGNERSPLGLAASSARMDQACGGPWWREYFTDPQGLNGPDPAEAVAAEYGRRLATETGMTVVSVPVRREPHHKPVYYLVFATRSPYGLWVFGDAVARARNAWWETLEIRQDTEDEGALFTRAQILRPDPKLVLAEAVPVIAENIARLHRERGRFKLVDDPLGVFGSYYGQVTEPAARAAVQHLHSDGRIRADGVGVKTREIQIF